MEDGVGNPGESEGGQGLDFTALLSSLLREPYNHRTPADLWGYSFRQIVELHGAKEKSDKGAFAQEAKAGEIDLLRLPDGHDSDDMNERRQSWLTFAMRWKLSKADAEKSWAEYEAKWRRGEVE